jgi:rare lipoprotein A
MTRSRARRVAQKAARGFRLSRIAAACAALMLLAGCAEGELAINTSKKFNPPDRTPHGAYKVGNPYQIDGVWYYPAEDYGYDETGIASWYGPGFHEKFTANGEVFDQNDLTAAHRTLPMPCFVRVTNLDNGRAIVLRVNDRGPYARGRIIDVSRRSAQLLGFEGGGTAKVRVQIMANESRELADALRNGGAAAGAVMVARMQSQPGEPPPAAAPRNSVDSTPLAPPPSATPAVTPQPSQAASPPAQTQPPPAAAAPVELAALPDPTGQVRQVPPKRTSIFVQAGAFANRDNAVRLSNQLKSFGPSQVSPVTVAGQQLYRVRLGPLGSVEEGDRTLDLVVNSGHPEARLVVD